MKIKVRFDHGNGETVIATFDQNAGSVTTEDGRSGTFTNEGNAVHIKGAESMTLIFDGAPKMEIGAVSTYKRSDGVAGASTVLSMD